MSGGLDDMKHSVEVTTEPALVAAAFHKLDPAKSSQQMHMSLDCPNRPVERCS